MLKPPMWETLTISNALAIDLVVKGTPDLGEQDLSSCAGRCTRCVAAFSCAEPQFTYP